MQAVQTVESDELIVVHPVMSAAVAPKPELLPVEILVVEVPMPKLLVTLPIDDYELDFKLVDVVSG